MSRRTITICTPEPLNIHRAGIEQIAEKTRLSAKLEPGMSLIPFATSLGCKIEHVPAFTRNGRAPLAMHVRNENDFTVFLSTMLSDGRDRTSLAQEIGHHLLHYLTIAQAEPSIQMETFRYLRDTDPDYAELTRARTEAIWFGGALLMPSAEFKAAHQHDPSPNSLADKFGVTSAGAALRCRALGLASEASLRD